MVDGWTGTWMPEDDYSRYPKEKLCDMDRLYVILNDIYPEYKPKTSWEYLISFIFSCYDEEITSTGSAFSIDDCVQYMLDSGGISEFDYEV